MDEKQKRPARSLGDARVFCLIVLFSLLNGLVGCDVRSSEPRIQQGTQIAVGDSIDVSELELINGERRPVIMQGKRATLLTFWASWCMRCRAEMPALTRLHTDQPRDGIEVVGINAGEKPQRVKAFLQDHWLPYPIALDRESKLMSRFGLSGLPAMVLVGRNGVVRFVGNHLPEKSSDLERLLSD